MKVLIAHIPYLSRGGEDVHVETLIEVYRSIGIQPILYPESRNPSSTSPIQAFGSIFRNQPPGDFLELWQNEKPSLIHAHNLFPILGPSFLSWVIREKIPLIMTVHNHRFFCTNGLALRKDRICKDCFHSKIYWRPVLYNCNRSFSKTAYHSLSLTRIRLQNLYNRAVTRFIAPSPYIKNELIRLGVDEKKIEVMINPIMGQEMEIDPVLPSGIPDTLHVLFCGRLSIEKGIRQLIQTAALLPHLNFVIAGDGPERPAVIHAAKNLKNLTYVGQVNQKTVRALIERSKCGIIPSICNEILSSFAIESFYAGKPCVVPDMESTNWFTEKPFLGINANTDSPEKMKEAILKAIQAPTPDLNRMTDLRNVMDPGFFSQRLKTLVQAIDQSAHPQGVHL